RAVMNWGRRVGRSVWRVAGARRHEGQDTERVRVWTRTTETVTVVIKRWFCCILVTLLKSPVLHHSHPLEETPDGGDHQEWEPNPPLARFSSRRSERRGSCPPDPVWLSGSGALGVSDWVSCVSSSGCPDASSPGVSCVSGCASETSWACE